MSEYFNGGFIWALVIASITIALGLAIAGLMVYRRGDGLTKKLMTAALGLTVLSFVFLVGYTVFMTGEADAPDAMATENAIATDAPDGEPMPAAEDEAANEQAAGDVAQTGDAPEDGKVSDDDVETESDDTPEELTED